MLGVASGWCLSRECSWRTLTPWWLLAAYALGAGALTAYGRVPYGLDTAVLPRYQPTAELFTLSVVAIATLAVSDLLRVARRAGLVVLAAAALVVSVSARTQYASATTGVTAMALVQRQLEEGARCLTE